MNLDSKTIQAAHRLAAMNRTLLRESKECGCFHCESIFSPSSIEEWIEETQGSYSEAPDPFTALCPDCGIDSVLGDACPYPVTDPAFLHAMRLHWFGEKEAA
ncbi:cytoplasmic protein [Qipengyuania spongiae]|uniref:V-type ATPase subunit a family protein n=1 Tax=Qipengyuania spongiae TaxID=2909673 RepID=A0ABY5T0H1_9SPHN|nr:cytoplasmic protein [Qipengyuania spongiae]UVI39905.1 V-type ATPase subunit a family protein [Qipengyuania spongiae]